MTLSETWFINKDGYFMFWNMCFVGVFFKCIFLNLCEPFAFNSFSLTALPFKNSNYFTCVSVYVDLNLHYVDCICLAYQMSTLWKNQK